MRVFRVYRYHSQKLSVGDESSDESSKDFSRDEWVEKLNLSSHSNDRGDIVDALLLLLDRFLGCEVVRFSATQAQYSSSLINGPGVASL